MVSYRAGRILILILSLFFAGAIFDLNCREQAVTEFYDAVPSEITAITLTKKIPQVSPGKYAGEELEIVLCDSLEIIFSWIPEGEFMMGSLLKTDEIRSCYVRRGSLEPFLDEFPARRTVITKGFFLGKTEVTQRQWNLLMESDPSFWKGETLPVDSVSYSDCMKFIDKINAFSVSQFRLPTEAEWEYAARAGTNSPYPWGKYWEWGYAWSRENSDMKTHPAGVLKPNAWNLYDMMGNVAEWTMDSYSEDFYTKASLKDPCCSENSVYHTLRGGSWYNDFSYLRVSYRNRGKSEFRWNDRGFRLVLTP